MSRRINRDLLISEVESRPMLWQDVNRDPKFKKFVETEWTDLTLSLNTVLSVKELKKKWKNLKDQYRKEVQRLSKPGRESKISKWQYFDRLSFLKDVMFRDEINDPLATPPNCNTEHTQMEPDADSDVKNAFTFQDENAILKPSPQDERGQLRTSPRNEKKKLNPSAARNSYTTIKRKRTNLKKKVLEVEKDTLAYLKKEIERITEENRNPDLLFFKSLVPHLESFTETEKFELKTNIMQMILTAKKH